MCITRELIIIRSTKIFFPFPTFLHLNMFFLTKLLKLGILFSTVVKAAVVAKLVTPGISPLTSFDYNINRSFLS